MATERRKALHEEWNQTGSQGSGPRRGVPIRDLDRTGMTNADSKLNSQGFSVVRAKPEDFGMRLDRFLTEKLPEISRSQIQRMIEGSGIQVNGREARPSLRIRGTEVITIFPREVPSTELHPEPIPLEVLYEDEDLAVINKPAGLAVHSGAGMHGGTLVNALLYHFGQLSSGGNIQRPGIVHRLDKGTSGLLVVAKSDFAHLQLSRQFQSRTVTKVYIALVHGRLEKQQGEITSPIGRDRAKRTRMTTRAARTRDAYTRYQVLERFENFTLVQVNIRTGRTHQIRVHLSSIKHPVAGDRLYGAPLKIVLPARKRQLPALDRNFLHASELEFLHPRTLQRLGFASPLPKELTDFLDQLRERQGSGSKNSEYS